MVRILESLIEEFPKLDLSTKEGILEYQIEQEGIKNQRNYTGCFSFPDGCVSPGCFSCYSVD